MSSSRVIVHFDHNGSFNFSYVRHRDCVDSMFWYYDHVLIVFLSFVHSWGSAEGVGNYVCFSGDVFQLEVIFLEVGMPSRHSSV